MLTYGISQGWPNRVHYPSIFALNALAVASLVASIVLGPADLVIVADVLAGVALGLCFTGGNPLRSRP